MNTISDTKPNPNKCLVCAGTGIQWVLHPGHVLKPEPCPFCLGKKER